MRGFSAIFSFTVRLNFVYCICEVINLVEALLKWYDAQKRSFVFRGTHDPYRVWVSEIMLQQTRTETVEPYYSRFMEAFPDVMALASAEESAVLKLWEGLGYYSRARNLFKAAKVIAFERGAEFPVTAAQWRELPGIGDYTSAAIASIAFDERVPALDGNLIRVLSRYFDIRENMDLPESKNKVREMARELMPETRSGDVNQAFMDIGATLCLPKRADCHICPLAPHCASAASGDALSLPVMNRKKPPQKIKVAVGLVFAQGKVLVFEREERLLKGLSVFALCEGDDSSQALIHSLEDKGLKVTLIQDAGETRHIFTHRVWEMKLYVFETPEALVLPNAHWVDASGLKAIPIPGAMRSAREKALQLLGDKGA